MATIVFYKRKTIKNSKNLLTQIKKFTNLRKKPRFTICEKPGYTLL